MIDVLQAPQQDALLWDSNQTIIKLRSYRPDTAYFKALISIDDLLFTTQNWSKDATGVSQQNLEQLYYSYFVHDFNPIATGLPSISALGTLKKKVSIEIQECLLGTDTVIESISLPDYYIHFNERASDVDLTGKLALLSPSNLTAPINGKLRISLFTDLTAFDLDILDDTDTQNYPATTITPATAGIQSLDIDLSSLPVAFGQDAKTATIKISNIDQDIFINVKLSRKQLFPARQLYYRNDYGNYESAYLFGQQTQESELDHETYLDNNLSPVTYYVEDIEVYEIGSGNDYLPLTGIMHAISRSLDVKLYLDGLWTTIACTTDNILRKVDRQYIYQEVLSFERNANRFIDNNGYIDIVDILDLTYTIDEATILEIPIADLNTSANGATYDRIRILDSTDNARYGYNSNGQIVFTNQPFSQNDISPEGFLIADITTVVYFPYRNLSGSPLDILRFQLGNGNVWSNPANLIVNVTDLNPGNSAPIIYPENLFLVFLDQNFNGSTTVDVEVFDPDGDNLTYQWEVLNNAPITFDDATIQDPVVTLTGADTLTNYQIKLTATDSVGNFAVQIFDIRTAGFLISVSSTVNSSESTASRTVYDVVISGLPQGESVDLVSESITNLNEQVYRIDFEQESEKISSSVQRIVRSKVTNQLGGDFTVKVAFENDTENTDAKLIINLDNPSIGLIDDKNAETQLIPQ